MAGCIRCSTGTNQCSLIRGIPDFSMCYGSVANEVKGRRGCSPHFKKALLKITEEGAWFRSYIDGVRHSVTTEISIQTQRSPGADLILAFDDQILLHKT